jgi:hypothetical protein
MVSDLVWGFRTRVEGFRHVLACHKTMVVILKVIEGHKLDKVQATKPTLAFNIGVLAKCKDGKPRRQENA